MVLIFDPSFINFAKVGFEKLSNVYISGQTARLCTCVNRFLTNRWCLRLSCSYFPSRRANVLKKHTISFKEKSSFSLFFESVTPLIWSNFRQNRRLIFAFVHIAARKYNCRKCLLCMTRLTSLVFPGGDMPKLKEVIVL